MTHGPRPTQPVSPVRTILAFVLAAGLIALAGIAAFMLFSGRVSLLSDRLGTQQSQASELPPGEPTLLVEDAPTSTATPSPESATGPTAVLAARPTETATPQKVPLADEVPDPSPTAGPPVHQAIVNEDIVNVRSGPGTNYPVLEQVLAGQPFEAIGRNEDSSWLKICCPVESDESGWINAPLVAITAPPETLPLAEIPPTPEPVAAAPVVVPDQPNDSRAAAVARPAAGLPGSGGFAPPGETNPLTGLPLGQDQRGQRPVIVCINNDFAARPQFGTSRADVVYEYLMEGFGITRFSAVYYGDSSSQIGPIRSARLINLSMGVLYDAGLVCSGASDAVRFSLKNDAPFPYLDIDLDDPSNSRYTVSIGNDYRTRLRTDSESLRRWLVDWGAERAPSLQGFTFGDLPAGGAPASEISIPYPASTGSQVAYRYDPGSGRYLRFLGGAPHLDGNSGAQLALDTVIVQYVPHEVTDIVEDSLGSKSIRLNLFGSGRALVFRNGVGFEGTWQSNSGGELPRFFGGDGQEIPLKPGRSWISIVPLTYAIAYQ
ncbi:MAG: DUF3048 domain-containing protein [Caldilineaceae bacterium]